MYSREYNPCPRTYKTKTTAGDPPTGSEEDRREPLGMVVSGMPIIVVRSCELTKESGSAVQSSPTSHWAVPGFNLDTLSGPGELRREMDVGHLEGLCEG